MPHYNDKSVYIERPGTLSSQIKPSIVEPLNKGHFGDYSLSLVERLSLSRRENGTLTYLHGAATSVLCREVIPRVPHRRFHRMTCSNV